MKNEKVDIEKIIEQMRALRDRRIDEIEALSNQNGVPTDRRELGKNITVKYLGKMELVNEQGELAEKDVFVAVEQVNGEFQFRYYDEDQNALGIQRAFDQDIILSMDLSSEPMEEQERIKEDLEAKDKDEAKTLEQLEEEHRKEQQAKEAQMGQDLANTTGNPELKINTYRRIVDNVFPQEFPEMCSGAKEIGTARLEDGTFMIVADYGNGFEIARGTEPARTTMEQVYDIDRTNQTAEKKSPHALLKVTGNGYKGDKKEIAVTLGSYGYIEMKVVDRAPDNTRVGRDVREQGESIDEQKPLEEQLAEREQGVDAPENIGDLVSGQENADNDYMKQQIVESVLESHEEELESLYGDEPEQEAAVRRYIEEAVTNRGIIVPEDIQKFVEDNLEADYGAFFRDPSQH